MKNFKELRIWQRSHQLVLDIYLITKSFPKEEVYGLTSQIRRSCASIPTNIAEGCGRNSDAELKRFLTIVMGSASELEYQLILSNDLGYIQTDNYEKLNNELIEIRKMLNTFIHKLGK
ncbi:four helix bundle protein [Emticicia sp. W12TSBA100-4]|uniref:four helix bundle protein n=1 Tax=Emticicia sp. W12TSBA100-4 TaxID=3160965 RepID=UPI003305F0EE